MRPDLPESPTDKDWQEDGHAHAQTPLDLIDPQDNLDKISDTYEVMRKAVSVFGGRKRLALELGNPIDYEANISSGLNRRPDRHAFIDWRVPLLRHPEAGALLLSWDCALSNHKMPERRPVASDGELLKALTDVLKDAGALGDDVVARAAKRLGVDTGSFRK